MRATVIGGGPAGLMAAEHVASDGHDVTLFEHKRSVGRKFLLAGRGGLNITHSESIDQLLESYGERRDRLAPLIGAFGPDDLRAWCAGLGEPCSVGTSGRVFPESFRATPLLRAWLVRLGDLGVTIEVGQRWEGFADASGLRSRFRSISTGHERIIDSDVTIVALGGASWPRVGSDGTWVEHFAAGDIGVEPLAASNCGIECGWTTHFSERFAGTPIKNVEVRVGDEAGTRGDVMVTEAGLEGGPIYANSSRLRTALEMGSASVALDLWPDLDVSSLADRLATRRRTKDSTSTWLGRCGIQPAATGLLREVTNNDLPTDSAAMAAQLKHATVEVATLASIDRAISSAGGVRFDALDDSLMITSMPGVFVAGEMLDWEAPTGGYLLQATFSTAVAAASGACRWLRGTR